MKRNTDLLLFFCIILVVPLLLGFSQINPSFETEKQNPAGKELRQFLSKMIYMEGDTFIMGRTSSSYISITPADSTLFTGVVPSRTIVESFFISATEVTNGDWKEFYHAKVEEMGEPLAKNKFFPDTSLWLTEFRYSYNEPHAKHYYAHSKFDNFPVVGISWDQATAYCQWKSKKLKSLFEKIGIQQVPEFRLPTEAEWEYAAIKKEKDGTSTERPVSFWSENLQIGHINELANIGQIFDINKLTLKQYADDGCLYTCQVASYPSNDNAIFDMLGNVSEWTSDEGYIELFGLKNSTYKRLKSPSEIDGEIERIKNEDDVEDAELQRMLLESLAQNRKVLSSTDIKICKGGSWANGLIYTQAGSRQGFKKDKASTKIGFRLAISNVNEDVKKYFPKKELEAIEIKNKWQINNVLFNDSSIY